MNLLILASAPVLIIAFYIYVRDKYEKEPLVFLLKALVAGMIIVLPVIYIEKYLSGFKDSFSGLFKPAYNAFIIAAVTEELFKYLAFIILIYNNKNFNEKFDGIVYAVFISLGFALVENIIYVTGYGFQAGYIRAFTAVPGHALFGVIMGYHLGLAKFYPDERIKQFILALIFPILLHGIYDFILMSGKSWLLIFFIPFLIYLWLNGFRKIRDLSNRSIYRISLWKKKSIKK